MTLSSECLDPADVTVDASRGQVAHSVPLGVLRALIQGESLSEVVPVALKLLERDPLASGGYFRGDLIRCLMEVPGQFWWHRPELWEQYRGALRAAALLRRELPPQEQSQFWSVLPGEF